MSFIRDFIDFRKERKALKNLKKSFIKGEITFIDLFAAIEGYTGDQFYKGFGITKDFRVVNQKRLQLRSIQLVRSNVYVSMLFGRLKTKVINKGLTLNTAPLTKVLSENLPIQNENFREWSRYVESLFTAWGQDAEYISYNKKLNFNKAQQFVYDTSNLSGDCLVVVSINKNNLPVYQLIDGYYVSNPLPGTRTKGKIIVDGVEMDSRGNEIAYWVEDGKGGHNRVEAWGRGTKRRRAWLVKGTQQRLDDVRGLPLLLVILQNINEAGKYMSSEQRAALVNSYVAMTRHRDKNQSPLVAASRRKEVALSTETKQTENGEVKFEEQQPGLFYANLAPDERIDSHDTKRPNINFAPFMEAILKPMSAAFGIPPETFFLEYGNNFSASRMAQIDLTHETQLRAYNFAIQFNQIIYKEWFIGEVLNGKIKAPGFMQSFVDKDSYEVRNAYLNANWKGLPVVNVDFLKQMKGLELASTKSWLTDEYITENYFGLDWWDNIARKKAENQALSQVNNTENGVTSTMQFMMNFSQLFEKMSSLESKIDDLEDKFVDSEQINE